MLFVFECFSIVLFVDFFDCLARFGRSPSPPPCKQDGQASQISEIPSCVALLLPSWLVPFCCPPLLFGSVSLWLPLAPQAHVAHCLLDNIAIRRRYVHLHMINAIGCQSSHPRLPPCHRIPSQESSGSKSNATTVFGCHPSNNITQVFVCYPGRQMPPKSLANASWVV